MTKTELLLRLLNSCFYGKNVMSHLPDSDPLYMETKGISSINNVLLQEDYWDSYNDIECFPEAEAYYAANEYRQYMASCEANEEFYDEEDNY